ncbi:TlpA disulfide reductase family protein [Streptomyces sp. NBC_00996]|uniref:TlpA disulfide reductase family protein n=1 Tax=Streptomyces sp. NBC_00996 TaxID=2903710 RepID=UPI003863F629|nr:TlpA family protein disulfide reductase [Streptomyces sp. NBC_00996]
MSAACRADQRPNRTRRGRAALLTAVAAFLLSACGSGGAGNTDFVAGKNGVDTAAKGHRTAIPDLSGKTIDGKQLDVRDFKGKVVVVNVWGSLCGPCRAEAANFERVYLDTKDQGVQFVGINTRDSSTSPALAFEKEHGVTYPSLYDPTGKLMLRFKKGTLNPQLIPSTLIIDREGKVAARTLQALSEDNLRKMLNSVLAEK